MPHFLVVEDDTILLDALTSKLSQCGYQVSTATTGLEAQKLLQEHKFDGLVLDLGLPLLDGMELLRWLRQRDETLPVMVLTARINIEDRVAGLRAGADDYLIKPFAMAELKARIEALLRRSNLQAPVAVLAPQDSSAPPVLRLDPVGRSAWLQNQELELAPREWTLLRLLTEHFGNAISRAQIIAASEQDADAAANLMQTNTPEVYIHRLRKKLEHSPVTIRTVRGLGYMLRNR